ncbi:hypothetical protein [Bradyrhizobium sp. ERR14]|uniref:hypothetical protein n=1 Tax=Bradyrhizobium sp. ERR14 TaxID=2663837 RepID=UPI00160E6F84|nr:hypothetical protein [Bradyrhizobium sp. ERR14]MBB4398793.1 hypothetical protein [Bradyrhizobium sp. ERR14]
MKLMLGVTFLLLVLLANRGGAQQYYSFEEACRRAGVTTGACSPKPQQQPKIKSVRICQNAFHAEKSLSDGVEATLSPAIDSEIFVEMIGLPNIPKINELKLTIYRSIGYNNAVACFSDEARTIVYDPLWAQTATAEAYLILAHEAGHHFCEHTLGTLRTSPREAELEADRFSGAAIKRFETYHGKAFLDDALKAVARLYHEPGSQSHPPRVARVKAVMLGYNSGSPCGDLAPGIPGYSRQPR